MYTTFPTFIITFIVFCIITLNLNSSTSNDAIEIGMISQILKEDFYISPLLFVIPASVLILAYFKVKPLIALSLGVLFAIIFAVIFQSNILEQINVSTSKAIFSSVFTFTEIPLEVSYNTENTKLFEGINDLYTRGGMESMLWVILLTMCAMVFGGAMEAIGALNKITNELLKLADSAFGLVASTVASCLGVNLFASDQYLAIIIPGKMFKNAYEEYDLAPENLSRTLEDSGTVTSALIPWNTCGAYHYGVLGVSVVDYFIYAVFNWLSPIMTLIYAGIGIKIKSITNNIS
jgi:NhaC family Na+:H+ antiporter